jgi:hypothetical protein
MMVGSPDVASAFAGRESTQSCLGKTKGAEFMAPNALVYVDKQRIATAF